MRAAPRRSGTRVHLVARTRIAIDVPRHRGELELEALEARPHARERCQVRVARGEQGACPGAQREAAELGEREERREHAGEGDGIVVVRAVVDGELEGE